MDISTDLSKWNDRVLWSFQRLVYHVFSMHVMYGELDESYVAQIHEWIDRDVDESVRNVCKQAVGDTFTKVTMMLAMAEGKKDKVNFKIDPGYPVRWENLPNTLRYNDLFNMHAFFEIPCVQEVIQYVKEIDLRAG